MKTCLQKLFTEDIDNIKVHDNSFVAWYHGKNTIATTRKNNIYLNIDCATFWNDRKLVLHEYYHVIEQWNTGRLTRYRYIKEWMKKGYWNSKYEVEARNFAQQKLDDFNECMECPATYLFYGWGP